MLSCLRFETLLMRLNGDIRGNLYDRDSEYIETEDDDIGIENEEGKEEGELDESDRTVI